MNTQHTDEAPPRTGIAALLNGGYDDPPAPAASDPDSRHTTPALALPDLDIPALDIPPLDDHGVDDDGTDYEDTDASDAFTPAPDGTDLPKSPATPPPPAPAPANEDDTDSPYADPVAREIAAATAQADTEAEIATEEARAYARILGTERARQRRSTELNPGRTDSWATLDLTGHLDGTISPTTPTMFARTDGIHLLYPGLVHSMFGENESGKSFVALAIAAEQIRAGRTVLYLDYESDEALIAQRLRALGITPTQASARLDYRRPEIAPDPTNAAWTALLATPRDLVVIDGVTAALATHGINSNDNDEVTRWWREVPTTIANNTNAAVLLIDHVTKSNDGRGRYPLGAQAKLANITGAAFMLDTTKSPIAPGTLGHLTLRVAKDRPGQVRRHGTDYRAGDRSQLIGTVTVDSTTPGATTVTLTPGAPPTSLSAAATADLDRRNRVMTYVTLETFTQSKATGTVPSFTKTALRTALGGSRDELSATIDTLTAEGYLNSTGPRSGYKLNPDKPYADAIAALKMTSDDDSK